MGTTPIESAAAVVLPNNVIHDKGDLDTKSGRDMS